MIYGSLEYADLKIYLVRDLENGSSEFKTHLYDYQGVSATMAEGVDAPWKGRAQGSLSRLGQVRTT